MILRPYQEKIINSAIDHLSKENRLMIVVPTGGGKTVIFSEIAHRMGLKTLVVSHTKELVTQAEKHLSAKDVYFSSLSIQQAASPKGLQKVAQSNYELLIIDECHRAGAPSYLKIIDAILKNPTARVIGTTATPFRSDSVNLSLLFPRRISPLTMVHMIEEGFLCDFVGYRVKTETSLKGISTKDGDFMASRLGPVVNVKQRNEIIVREYLNICKGKRALCFCATINHARELDKVFKENEVASACISGETRPEVRKKILQDFKTGVIEVITNCNLLTEGFDEPSIECLIMARPTQSKTLYMQMIGRGSRIHNGKDVCHVIEFTDNEYDVCFLESMESSKNHSIRIGHGEKWSSFSKRLEKELENSTGKVVLEYYKMTKNENHWANKEATLWQLDTLNSMNIPFERGITQLEADQLITGNINGINLA